MKEFPKVAIEFFAWMALLWGLWIFSNGPARISNIDQPFIKPYKPLNTWNDFGEFSNTAGISVADIKKIIKIKNEDEVTFSEVRISLLLDRETGRDYIEIYAMSSNKKPVNITGWTIKGVMDVESRAIGTGVYSFKQGKINKEEGILLYPGQKALVLPDSSPVGVSFLMNKCIGYLEQFQSFVPHLPQICPIPVIKDSEVNSSDKTCKSFLESIPCSTFIKEYPTDVSENCKKIVGLKFNYNSCALEHENDKDFLKGEWKVYLDGNNTFGSKDGDFISIFDKKGNLVDTIFYNQ